jgi:hypothetical protein
MAAVLPPQLEPRNGTRDHRADRKRDYAHDLVEEAWTLRGRGSQGAIDRVWPESVELISIALLDHN